MARVITAPGIVRNVSKYLNSMRRVPFAIGKDDWTEVDSSTYTYEFVTAYVTTSSFDIGTFDNSVHSYAKGDISMEKKDGGGGMVFTTTKRPTGTVSGSIYIWDNNDNKVPVILEDTVVPIENGGTDATSVPGILSNLGLGSANDAQETLEFGDAVHEDVANNLTTTSEGYVLDARQGKVLKDSVDELDGKVQFYGTLGNDVLATAKGMPDNQIRIYKNSNQPTNRPTNGDWGMYVFRKSDGVCKISYYDNNIECFSSSVANTSTEITWNQLALNSKYVYESKSLGTQTVGAGARAIFNADVAKTGYTLIGIVSIGLVNNYMAIGSYTIESTTHAQVVLHNLSNSSAEQTVYVKLLYEKT